MRTAPDYKLHRDLSAADATPTTLEKSDGVNMHGFRFANVQVHPDGGAAGAVVYFWSADEDTPGWVIHNPSIAPTASANPYEFEVECNGRIMLIALTGNGGKVWVGGYDPRGNV